MNNDKKISELPLAPNLALDDILPVVHDGITSKVTLRNLISELSLSIPQPRIKIQHDFEKKNYGHDQVYAFWDSSDDKFLKFNPKFFIYRYKKAELKISLNKKSGNRDHVFMKKRFVHPSHLHGKDYSREDGASVKGWRYYDGAQFATINGITGKIPARNTEWEVDLKPINETLLDLGPWNYFRIAKKPMQQNKFMVDELVGNLPDRILPQQQDNLSPDDFPLLVQPVPRGTGSSKSRFIVFKVRIAIDNPNPNSDQPKLFGPFSETFILYPHKDGNRWTSLRYFLGPEASPRLRSKL